MNAERLRGLVTDLVESEKELNIQDALQNLNGALTNFSNQPQEQQHQLDVAKNLDVLKNRLAAVEAKFDPAKLRAVKDIGAGEFFSSTLAATIAEAINENPMTPAVVQQLVGKLFKQRANYLTGLTQLIENLERVGIVDHTIEPGTAELGFLIPRSIFNNNLDGLVKELKQINRIIRAFSEAATGSAEEVEIKQISTTDPLFFFGLNPVTVALLAGAVNWALKVWKQVEDIRKVRAETKKLGVFTDAAIEQMYGAKIQEIVSGEVGVQIAEMLGDHDGKAGRKSEQRTDLTWALEAVLARIERGMTVEVRFLPPLTKPGEDPATEVGEETMAAFDSMAEAKMSLTFPEPSEAPIFKLPPAPTPPEAKPRNKSAS